MKKKMFIRMFLLVELIMLLICAALNVSGVLANSVTDKEISELEVFIKEKSKFNELNVIGLVEMIRNASGKDLPMEFIMNRVKEGIVKRAGYNVLSGVVKNYIQDMSAAKIIVDKISEIKTQEDRNYYIRYIGELFNRGLKLKQWENITEASFVKKLNIKNIVGNAEVFVKLTEKDVSPQYAMDVIEKGIKNNYKFEGITRIGQVYIEAFKTCLSDEEIHDILIEGINKGAGVYNIIENIEEMNRIVERERHGSIENRNREQVKEEIRDNKNILERMKRDEKNKR